MEGPENSVTPEYKVTGEGGRASSTKVRMLTEPHAYCTWWITRN